MILLILILTFSFLNAKEISLSFDDAPMPSTQYFTGTQRAQFLIQTLKASGVRQAIFYANPGKIKTPKDLQRLKAYQKAGHLIGNHTFTHPSAEKVSSNEFIREIDQTDSFLRKHKLLTPY